MNGHTRKFVLAILCSLALSLPCLVQASVISFEFASVYTGTAPSGSGTWASATFQSDKPGEVLLTLSGLGLTNSEFISNWYFNFNPDKSVDDLTFTYQSGVRPSSFTVSDGSLKAGPSKQFDILVSDPTANNGRFVTGSITTILITGIADLTAEDFAYDNKDGYFAAAHVQAILGGKSGWMWGDITATKKEVETLPTPEPTTLTLLGLGTLVGALARKRSRKSA